MRANSTTTVQLKKRKLNMVVKSIYKTLQPYLEALSLTERMEIPNISENFVEKTLDYVKSDYQFTTVYLENPELRIDVESINVLTQLYSPMLQKKEGLSDEDILEGSQAYLTSLTYYNSVKQAAKMNIPGAKSIYDDLEKRLAS